MRWKTSEGGVVVPVRNQYQHGIDYLRSEDCKRHEKLRLKAVSIEHETRIRAHPVYIAYLGDPFLNTALNRELAACVFEELFDE